MRIFSQPSRNLKKVRAKYTCSVNGIAYSDYMPIYFKSNYLPLIEKQHNHIFIGGEKVMIKKYLSITLISFLLLPIISYSQVNPNQDKDVYIFAQPGLKLRDYPRQEMKEKTVIPYGTLIRVISSDVNTSPFLAEGIRGNWVKVNYNDTVGYVFDGFLSRVPPPKEQPGFKAFMELLDKSGSNLEVEKSVFKEDYWSGVKYTVKNISLSELFIIGRVYGNYHLKGESLLNEPYSGPDEYDEYTMTRSVKHNEKTQEVIFFEKTHHTTGIRLQSSGNNCVVYFLEGEE